MSKPAPNKQNDISPDDSRLVKQSQSRMALILGFSALLAAIGVFVFGKVFLNIDSDAVNFAIGALADSPWALPVTIVIFCAAAFIGAPQWMLITASILAFGPVQGGIYAWAATLISAALDFWIARKIGVSALDTRLKVMSSQMLTKISQAIRKNGFTTSFVVRLVPTGPFVLVNFAAGLSKMKFRAFLAGTALGIIPKIMVIVLIGLGVVSGVNKSLMAIFFGLLACVSAGLIMLAQNRFKS